MRPSSWATCLDAAAAHLAATYPDEGCGLILETDVGCRFHAAANVAPPSVASHRFELDPVELLHAESRGDRLRAIVHSHVDTDDAFSREDIRAALAPGTPRRPWYPGVDHLVIAITDGLPRSAALYRFAPPQAFRCIWRQTIGFTITATTPAATR